MPGFLKFLSMNVCMHACVDVCVCLPPRLLLTSVMMWRDYVYKLYSIYIASVVGMVSGRGLSIDAHCRKQSNKS